MRRLMGMVLACALATGPASAAGLGATAVPVWTHAIDPAGSDVPPHRGESVANLATAAGRVFLASGGAIRALDARTGVERWRSRDEGFGVPAASANLVVAIARDGVVHAFDVRTGAERWRSAGLAAPLAWETPDIRPLLRGLNDGGFFVLAPQSGLAAEIDASGKVLWSATYPQHHYAGITAIADGVVFVTAWEEGAIIHPVLNLFRIGRAGGLIAQVSNALRPLGFDGSRYWVLDASPTASTTVTIARLDTEKGNQRIPDADPWRYTPDDGASSIPGYGDAAIEHGFLYAWTQDGEGHDPLYRYRLAPPNGQRPILVSRDGAWIAGPYEDRVVVQRPTGLWLLHLVGDRVQTRNITTYAPPVVAQAVAFDGDLVYAALSDGRIVAVDVRDGEHRFAATTSCRTCRGIGVHDGELLAVCARTVFAFAKPR